MALFDLFRSVSSPMPTSDRKTLVARYKQVRQASMHLNSKLVKTIPKDVLDDGGKRLGMLQRNMLVLDTEDDLTVLMDYCLYDVRRQGRNAIEQYLIKSPPDADTEEIVILKSMQHATYSIFVVESVEHGIGVHVKDLRLEESRFVVDLWMANSSTPGLALAMRLLPFDGFSMSTGASLPVGVTKPGQREAIVNDLLARGTTDTEGNFDPAPIIRVLLLAGRSNHIQRQDVPGTRSISTRNRATPGLSQTSGRKVGRNEPCPCGSGRKFKHCCLR